MSFSTRSLPSCQGENSIPKRHNNSRRKRESGDARVGKSAGLAPKGSGHYSQQVVSERSLSDSNKHQQQGPTTKKKKSASFGGSSHRGDDVIGLPVPPDIDNVCASASSGTVARRPPGKQEASQSSKAGIPLSPFPARVRKSSSIPTLKGLSRTSSKSGGSRATPAAATTPSQTSPPRPADRDLGSVRREVNKNVRAKSSVKTKQKQQSSSVQFQRSLLHEQAPLALPITDANTQDSEEGQKDMRDLCTYLPVEKFAPLDRGTERKDVADGKAIRTKPVTQLQTRRTGKITDDTKKDAQTGNKTTVVFQHEGANTSTTTRQKDGCRLITGSIRKRIRKTQIKKSLESKSKTTRQFDQLPLSTTQDTIDFSHEKSRTLADHLVHENGRNDDFNFKEGSTIGANDYCNIICPLHSFFTCATRSPEEAEGGELTERGGAISCTCKWDASMECVMTYSRVASHAMPSHLVTTGPFLEGLLPHNNDTSSVPTSTTGDATFSQTTTTKAQTLASQVVLDPRVDNGKAPKSSRVSAGLPRRDFGGVTEPEGSGGGVDESEVRHSSTLRQAEKSATRPEELLSVEFTTSARDKADQNTVVPTSLCRTPGIDNGWSYSRGISAPPVKELNRNSREKEVGDSSLDDSTEDGERKCLELLTEWTNVISSEGSDSKEVSEFLPQTQQDSNWNREGPILIDGDISHHRDPAHDVTTRNSAETSSRGDQTKFEHASAWHFPVTGIQIEASDPILEPTALKHHSHSDERECSLGLSVKSPDHDIVSSNARNYDSNGVPSGTSPDTITQCTDRLTDRCSAAPANSAHSSSIDRGGQRDQTCANVNETEHCSPGATSVDSSSASSEPKSVEVASSDDRERSNVERVTSSSKDCKVQSSVCGRTGISFKKSKESAACLVSRVSRKTTRNTRKSPKTSPLRYDEGHHSEDVISPAENDSVGSTTVSLTTYASRGDLKEYSTDSVLTEYSRESVPKENSNESVLKDKSSECVLKDKSSENVLKEYSSEIVLKDNASENVRKEYSREIVLKENSSESVLKEYSIESDLKEYFGESVPQESACTMSAGIAWDREVIFDLADKGLKLEHSPRHLTAKDQLENETNSAIYLTRITDANVLNEEIHHEPCCDDDVDVFGNDGYVSSLAKDADNKLHSETQDPNLDPHETGPAVQAVITTVADFKEHSSADADAGTIVTAKTFKGVSSTSRRKSQLMSPPSRKKGAVASKENVCGTTRDRRQVDKYGGKASGVLSTERLAPRPTKGKATSGMDNLTSATLRQEMSREAKSDRDVSGMTSRRISTSDMKGGSLTRKPTLDKTAAAKAAMKTAVTVVVRSDVRAVRRSISPKQKQFKENENRKQKSASPQSTTRASHQGDSGKTGHLSLEKIPLGRKSEKIASLDLEALRDAERSGGKCEPKAALESSREMSSPEKEKVDSPTKETAKTTSPPSKKNAKPSAKVYPKSDLKSGSVLQKQVSRLPRRSTESLSENKTMSSRYSTTSSATLRRSSLSSKGRLTSTSERSSSDVTSLSASSTSLLTFQKSLSPESDVSTTSSRNSLMSSTSSSSRLKAKEWQARFSNGKAAPSAQKPGSRGCPTQKTAKLRTSASSSQVAAKCDNNLRLRKTFSPSSVSECSLSTRDSSADSLVEDDSTSIVSSVSLRSGRSSVSGVSSSKVGRKGDRKSTQAQHKFSLGKKSGRPLNAGGEKADKKKTALLEKPKSDTARRRGPNAPENFETAPVSPSQFRDSDTSQGTCTGEGKQLAAAEATRQTTSSSRSAENWQKARVAVLRLEKGSSQKTATTKKVSTAATPPTAAAVSTATKLHKWGQPVQDKAQAGKLGKTSLLSVSREKIQPKQHQQQLKMVSRLMKSDKTGFDDKSRQTIQQSRQARENRSSKQKAIRSPSEFAEGFLQCTDSRSYSLSSKEPEQEDSVLIRSVPDLRLTGEPEENSICWQAPTDPSTELELPVPETAYHGQLMRERLISVERDLITKSEPEESEGCLLRDGGDGGAKEKERDEEGGMVGDEKLEAEETPLPAFGLAASARVIKTKEAGASKQASCYTLPADMELLSSHPLLQATGAESRQRTGVLTEAGRAVLHRDTAHAVCTDRVLDDSFLDGSVSAQDGNFYGFHSKVPVTESVSDVNGCFDSRRSGSGRNVDPLSSSSPAHCVKGLNGSSSSNDSQSTVVFSLHQPTSAASSSGAPSVAAVQFLPGTEESFLWRAEVQQARTPGHTGRNGDAKDEPGRQHDYATKTEAIGKEDQTEESSNEGSHSVAPVSSDWEKTPASPLRPVLKEGGADKIIFSEGTVIEGKSFTSSPTQLRRWELDTGPSGFTDLKNASLHQKADLTHLAQPAPVTDCINEVVKPLAKSQPENESSEPVLPPDHRNNKAMKETKKVKEEEALQGLTSRHQAERETVAEGKNWPVEVTNRESATTRGQFEGAVSGIVRAVSGEEEEQVSTGCAVDWQPPSCSADSLTSSPVIGGDSSPQLLSILSHSPEPAARFQQRFPSPSYLSSSATLSLSHTTSLGDAVPAVLRRLQTVRTPTAVRKLMTSSHPPFYSTPRPAGLSKQRPKSSPCVMSCTNRRGSGRLAGLWSRTSLSQTSTAMSLRPKVPTVVTQLPFLLQRTASSHACSGAGSGGGRGGEREGLASVLPADTALPSEEPWTHFPAGNAAATGSACLCEQQDAGEERATDSQACLADIAELSAALNSRPLYPTPDSALRLDDPPTTPNTRDTYSSPRSPDLFATPEGTLTPDVFSTPVESDPEPEVSSEKDFAESPASCPDDSSQLAYYYSMLPGLLQEGEKSDLQYSAGTTDAERGSVNACRTERGREEAASAGVISTSRPSLADAVPCGQLAEALSRPLTVPSLSQASLLVVTVAADDVKYSLCPSAQNVFTERHHRPLGDTTLTRETWTPAQVEIRTYPYQQQQQQQHGETLATAKISNGINISTGSIVAAQPVVSTPPPPPLVSPDAFLSSSDSCSDVGQLSARLLMEVCDTQAELTSRFCYHGQDSMSTSSSSGDMILSSSSAGCRDSPRAHHHLQSESWHSLSSHPMLLAEHGPKRSLSSENVAQEFSDRKQHGGLVSSQSLSPEVLGTSSPMSSSTQGPWMTSKMTSSVDAKETTTQNGVTENYTSVFRVTVCGENDATYVNGSDQVGSVFVNSMKSGDACSAAAGLPVVPGVELFVNSSGDTTTVQTYSADSGISRLTLKDATTPEHAGKLCTPASGIQPEHAGKLCTPASGIQQITYDKLCTPASGIQQITYDKLCTPASGIQQITHDKLCTPASVIQQIIYDKLCTPASDMQEITYDKLCTPASDMEEITYDKLCIPANDMQEITCDKLCTPASDMQEITCDKLCTPASDMQEITCDKLCTPANDMQEITCDKLCTPASDMQEITYDVSQHEAESAASSAKSLRSNDTRLEEDRNKVKVPTKKMGAVSAKPISTCVHELQKLTQEEHTSRSKKVPQPVTLTSVKDSVMKFETSNRSSKTTSANVVSATAPSSKRSSSTSSSLRAPMTGSEDKTGLHGKHNSTAIRLSRSASTSRGPSSSLTKPLSFPSIITTSSSAIPPTASDQAVSWRSETAVTATVSDTQSSTGKAGWEIGTCTQSQANTADSAAETLSCQSEREHPRSAAKGKDETLKGPSRLEAKISEMPAEEEKDCIGGTRAARGCDVQLATSASDFGGLGLIENRPVKKSCEETEKTLHLFSDSSIIDASAQSIQARSSSGGAGELQNVGFEKISVDEMELKCAVTEEVSAKTKHQSESTVDVDDDNTLLDLTADSTGDNSAAYTSLVPVQTVRHEMQSLTDNRGKSTEPDSTFSESVALHLTGHSSLTQTPVRKDDAGEFGDSEISDSYRQGAEPHQTGRSTKGSSVTHSETVPLNGSTTAADSQYTAGQVQCNLSASHLEQAENKGGKEKSRITAPQTSPPASSNQAQAPNLEKTYTFSTSGGETAWPFTQPLAQVAEKNADTSELLRIDANTTVDLHSAKVGQSSHPEDGAERGVGGKVKLKQYPATSSNQPDTRKPGGRVSQVVSQRKTKTPSPPRSKTSSVNRYDSHTSRDSAAAKSTKEYSSSALKKTPATTTKLSAAATTKPSLVSSFVVPKSQSMIKTCKTKTTASVYSKDSAEKARAFKKNQLEDVLTVSELTTVCHASSRNFSVQNERKDVAPCDDGNRSEICTPASITAAETNQDAGSKNLHQDTSVSALENLTSCQYWAASETSDEDTSALFKFPALTSDVLLKPVSDITDIEKHPSVKTLKVSSHGEILDQLIESAENLPTSGLAASLAAECLPDQSSAEQILQFSQIPDQVSKSGLTEETIPASFGAIDTTLNIVKWRADLEQMQTDFSADRNEGKTIVESSELPLNEEESLDRVGDAEESLTNVDNEATVKQQQHQAGIAAAENTAVFRRTQTESGQRAVAKWKKLVQNSRVKNLQVTLTNKLTTPATRADSVSPPPPAPVSPTPPRSYKWAREDGIWKKIYLSDSGLQDSTLGDSDGELDLTLVSQENYLSVQTPAPSSTSQIIIYSSSCEELNEKAVEDQEKEQDDKEQQIDFPCVLAMSRRFEQGGEQHTRDTRPPRGRAKKAEGKEKAEEETAGPRGSCDSAREKCAGEKKRGSENQEIGSREAISDETRLDDMDDGNFPTEGERWLLNSRQQQSTLSSRSSGVLSLLHNAAASHPIVVTQATSHEAVKAGGHPYSEDNKDSHLSDRAIFGSTAAEEKDSLSRRQPTALTKTFKSVKREKTALCETVTAAPSLAARETQQAKSMLADRQETRLLQDRAAVQDARVAQQISVRLNAAMSGTAVTLAGKMAAACDDDDNKACPLPTDPDVPSPSSYNATTSPLSNFVPRRPLAERKIDESRLRGDERSIIMPAITSQEASDWNYVDVDNSWQRTREDDSCHSHYNERDLEAASSTLINCGDKYSDIDAYSAIPAAATVPPSQDKGEEARTRVKYPHPLSERVEVGAPFSSPLPPPQSVDGFASAAGQLGVEANTRISSARFADSKTSLPMFHGRGDNNVSGKGSDEDIESLQRGEKADSFCALDRDGTTDSGSVSVQETETRSPTAHSKFRFDSRIRDSPEALRNSDIAHSPTGSRSPVPTRLSEGLRRFQKSRETPWGQQYLQRGDSRTSSRSSMAASNWHLLVSKVTASAAKEAVSGRKVCAAQKSEAQLFKEQDTLSSSDKGERTVRKTDVTIRASDVEVSSGVQKDLPADDRTAIVCVENDSAPSACQRPEIEARSQRSTTMSRTPDRTSDENVAAYGERPSWWSRPTSGDASNTDETQSFLTDSSDTCIETTFSETVFQSVIPARTPSTPKGGTPRRSRRTPERATVEESSASETKLPVKYDAAVKLDTPMKHDTPVRESEALSENAWENDTGGMNSSLWSAAKSEPIPKLTRQEGRSKIVDSVDEISSPDDRPPSKSAAFYVGEDTESESGVSSSSSSASSPQRSGRSGTSAKLISVTVWDTHDGDKTLRSGSRRVFWDFDNKEVRGSVRKCRV